MKINRPHLYLTPLCVLALFMPTSLTACSTSGGTVVAYFDSDFGQENTNGTAMAVDETSNHVFIVTSYPAVLKLNMQGVIVDSRALSTSYWAYGLALSVDDAKVIAVGGAGITVLSTADLSQLYTQMVAASPQLYDVTDNGVDKWYAVGGYRQGSVFNSVLLVEILQADYTLTFRLFSHSTPSAIL